MPCHRDVPLSRPLPIPHDTEASEAWAAHVAAGRIGRRLPTPPHVAANRARTEAILLGAHRVTRVREPRA